MNRDGLFGALDGAPAHALVVVGLALVLLAPLLLAFSAANLSSARAEFDQANALVELETEELASAQKAEQEKDLKDPAMPPEERMKREEARKETKEAKQEALKNQYKINDRKRAVLDAQVGFASSRFHLVLTALGYILLILGLLTLTVQSEGARQKVLLVILLVVLFSGLSGVHLDLQAQGRLGSSPSMMERGPEPGEVR